MKKQQFVLFVEKLCFFLIIILAIFLRFWQLDRVPPSASLDEWSIGYNAYSILKTGADEYGNRFPLLLRAYDDWRPALYVYLVIPFVRTFGLNVTSVRLPSVILSVLTMIAVYFLVKKMFKKERVAFLTTFLLAISPWHIYISRLGHEVNAGLAFFIFAMLFSFYRKAYPAAIFFILSFVSYQSEKIFVPLMILGMAIIYRKELFNQWKKIILIAVLSLIVLTPFFRETLQPNALIRFKGTSILEAKKEELAGEIGIKRRFLMGQIIIKNYFLNFNPQWLFENRGEESHKVPNFGVIYFWGAPFIIIGLIWMIRHIKNKQNQLLLFWLLVAPVPAALTTQAPHAIRTLQMLPLPQILISIGIIFVGHFLGLVINPKSKRFFIIFVTIIVTLFILINVINFYLNYFIFFPREQSQSFQYALKEAISYVEKNENKYDKIIFSNKDNLYQSYMAFLFYTKYDPKLYQSQGGTISGGFEETHQFGKYEFRPINWNQEKRDGKNLFVGNPKDLPVKSPKELLVNFKTFYYLDGKEGIKLAY